MPGKSVVVSLIAPAACLAFAGSAHALDIADATPPSGTVGVPYSYTFSLSPGSGSAGASWSIKSGALPPGLKLSSNDRTALVYGTPTQAGSFSFYIEVRDAPGPWVCCTQEEFTITIDQALVISAGSDLPLGNLGQAYGYQLATAGGTANSWAVTAGALPAGMQLTPSGAIVGTPMQAAVSQFTVRASNGSKTASKQFTLKVTEPMILTAPGPKAIKLGRQFLLSFGVKGGLGPYTWSGVNLPQGVGVNPGTGQVGGRPAAAGSLTVTVTVTDSVGASATGTATVTAAGAVLLETATLPVARVGKPYRARLVTAGGAGPLKLKLAGATPAWLRLDPTTGMLTGTPKVRQPKPKKAEHGTTRRGTVTLTYSVYVTAWDMIGQRVVKKLKLTVKA